jgi:hypothetical protein
MGVNGAGREGRTRTMRHRVELSKKDDHRSGVFERFSVGLDEGGIVFLDSTGYTRRGSLEGRDAYRLIIIAGADLPALAASLGLTSGDETQILAALVERARTDAVTGLLSARALLRELDVPYEERFSVWIDAD